jgi:hypothetical protein
LVGARAPTAGGPDEGPDAIADIVLERAWLENASGEPTANIELGEQITFHATFKAVRDVHEPTFGFMVANGDGVDVFGFGSSLSVPEGEEEQVRAGERIHFSTVIDNRLLAGRYVVKVWVHRDYNFGKLVMHTPHVLDFVAYGTHPPGGFVVIADESRARVEAAGPGASPAS